MPEKDSWTNTHIQSVYHYSEDIVSYDIEFLISDQKREIIFKYDFIMIARRRFMTNNLPKRETGTDRFGWIFSGQKGILRLVSKMVYDFHFQNQKCHLRKWGIGHACGHQFPAPPNLIPKVETGRLQKRLMFCANLVHFIRLN